MIGGLLYFITALVGLQVFSSAPAFVAVWSLAGTAGFTAAGLLVGWLRVREILRRARPALPAGHPVAIELFERWKGSYQLLTVAFYLGIVAFWRWGSFVNQTLGLKYAVLVDELLGLAPYLALVVGGWIIGHRLHRAVMRDPLPLGEYLRFNMHLTFTPLAPLVVFIAVTDLLPFLPYPLDLWLAGGMGEFAVAIVFLAIMGLLFPPLLMRLWGCRPLEPGPIRLLMEAVCREQHIGVRNIMLWNIGAGRFLNAAVLGFVRRFRYITFTRRLIECLAPDELVAVLGHEIGHARKHHLYYYLLISFGFLSFFMLAANVIGALVPLGGMMDELLMYGLTIGAVVLYWRVIFGLLSRRFEREADLFGMTVAGGAAPMIRSLEKLALLSDRPRNLPDWTHYSIAQRVAFLERAGADPAVAAGFTTATRRFARGFAVASLAMLALTFGLLARGGSTHAPLDRWFEREQYSRIERHLTAALEQETTRGLGRAEICNNLAWLYATSHDVHYRRPATARVYAEEAVTIVTAAIEHGDLQGDDPRVRGILAAYLDTFAAAEYAAGNNREAYRLSRMALGMCPAGDPSFANIMEAYEKHRLAMEYGDSYI